MLIRRADEDFVEVWTGTGYNLFTMQSTRNRKHISSRLVRPGESARNDEATELTTPEERIEAVWELTLLCLAWQGDQTGEPRLQRSVSRVQRSQR
jgi:hypothetical protein